MNSIEIPLSIFQPRNHRDIQNYVASITPSWLLYLQHKFWPKTASLLAAEFQPPKHISCFFPYVSWDKYHQTPILFMSVLFSKWPLWIKNVISIFKCKRHYRSCVLTYIVQKVIENEFSFYSGYVLYLLCTYPVYSML